MEQSKQWQFLSPEFDYHADFDDYVEAWIGHSFFGYDLISNLKPQLVVELGTYKGTSFYSFLQAAKDHKLTTRFCAVDSWEGDAQAGFYGEEVFELVNRITTTHYPNQNIELMRDYFADAVVNFADNSIDILHIDGLHTYDAVKADYETWKSKVKDDGVILFHDIAVQEFDVKDVWEEVKSAHPEGVTLDFMHSNGLGVLFKSSEARKLIPSKEKLYQHYEKLDDYINPLRIAALRQNVAQLYADKLALQKEVADLGSQISQYRNYVELLQRQLTRKSVTFVLNMVDKYSRLRQRLRK